MCRPATATHSPTAHLDEAEPARAPGVAIGHELDLGDRAPALGEEIADLSFVRSEREVADRQERPARNELGRITLSFLYERMPTRT
jgi:uncharacterized protein YifE (UPF0438 family)